MATIPTIPGQQVAPERAPAVFQQTGDTRGAFGEAQAAATAEGAEALGAGAKNLALYAQAQNEALAQISAREDLTARADAENALRARLDKELLDEQTRPDGGLSNTLSVQRFRGTVAQAATE